MHANNTEGELPEQQRDFLMKHAVLTTQIFDVHGMKPAEYLFQMLEGGYSVAIHTRPCEAHGHSMQNIKGHCIQCFPDVLSHPTDFDGFGEVYVAQSRHRDLVRVGSGKSADVEVKKLNEHGYGGAFDWALSWKINTEFAGWITHHAHIRLIDCFCSSTYHRSKKQWISHSLYACSQQVAINTISGVRLDLRNGNLLEPQDFAVAKHKDWMNPTPGKTRTVNAAFMEALTPSVALAAIVGATPLPRTEVVSKLWEYIKKKKLQDSSDKRMINADKKLLKLFDKPQVSMFEMAGLIGKHLR